MEPGIIQTDPPVREAIRALEQAKESMLVAISFIKATAIQESISEVVHLRLYQQTSDTINGLGLCIDTLTDSLKPDQSSTNHPRCLNLIE